MMYIVSIKLRDNRHNTIGLEQAGFSTNVLSSSEYHGDIKPSLYQDGWAEHNHCNHTFIKDGEILECRVEETEVIYPQSFRKNNKVNKICVDVMSNLIKKTSK